jgi:hypothetical protein
MKELYDILFVIFCIMLYFVPYLVGTHKRNSDAILALKLLLGWTFIGWVIALVWALTKEVPTSTYFREHQQELEKLN